MMAIAGQPALGCQAPRRAPPCSSSSSVMRRAPQSVRCTAQATPATSGSSTPALPAASGPPPGQRAANAPPQTIVSLPPAIREQGGLDPSTQSPEQREGYAAMLRQAFLPVDLTHPGLRVVNVDPPVLTVDNFVPDEVCDALVAAARDSGRMEASRVAAPQGPPQQPPQEGEVGAGASSAYAGVKDSVRTSSTLAMTQRVLDAVPALRPPLEALLGAACCVVDLKQLGQDPASLRKSLFSRPTVPGQIAPELPQVAHYLPGQHFLAHEDAFPGQIALQKGYQRRATVLCYLNDVPEGGATRFELMDLNVRPRKGKALIFFPSFSGGMPDARTLHLAEDAAPGCEKFVFQLWLVSALPTAAAAAAGRKQPAAAQAPRQQQPQQGSTGKPKKKRR